MATTRQMWLGAVFLPALMFVGTNMPFWTGPRFLGDVAIYVRLGVSATVLLFVAALPSSFWFAISALIYRKKAGEFRCRISKSLACLCFFGLYAVAMLCEDNLRHQAFERASFAGDRVVQALAEYRSDHGEYPASLGELVPQYIDGLPYTGLIGYPKFTYRKGYNDNKRKPGEYELRINDINDHVSLDRLIYWPSKEYPERIRGDDVERIRSWAHVRE